MNAFHYLIFRYGIRPLCVDSENRIKELKHDSGSAPLNPKSFWATEAALKEVISRATCSRCRAGYISNMNEVRRSWRARPAALQ